MDAMLSSAIKLFDNISTAIYIIPAMKLANTAFFESLKWKEAMAAGITVNPIPVMKMMTETRSRKNHPKLNPKIENKTIKYRV